MANFSEQEFNNIDRIQKGYEGFLRSYVPFCLDRDFGALNQMIEFYDEVNSISERLRSYRIIDGIELISDQEMLMPYNAKEHLELITQSQFEPKTLKFDDLVKDVIDASRNSENAVAVFYIKGKDKDEIRLGLAYVDNTLHIRSHQDSFGQKTWETAKISCHINDEGQVVYDKEAKELAVFKKALSEISGSKIDLETSEVEIEVLRATSGIDADRQNEFTFGISQQTLSSVEGKKHCLRMTQPWVLASLEYRTNIMSSDTIRELAGDGRFEAGNCVEIATAVGINFAGGIDSKFVQPRMRLTPTKHALETAPIRPMLRKIDPLHHQSLQTRAFGETQGFGFGEELDTITGIVDEKGAVVSVYGHAFFAVKETNDINVYDLALGYVGSLELYKDFLDNRGISTLLRNVTRTQPFNRESNEFYRRCRSMFFEPEIIALAEENFLALDIEQRDITAIYDCWKNALYAHPEIIADNLGIKLIGDHRPSDTKSATELMETQSTGFVCFEREFDGPNNSLKFVLIYENDKAFLAAGRFSTALSKKEAIEKLLSTSDIKVTAQAGRQQEKIISDNVAPRESKISRGLSD